MSLLIPYEVDDTEILVRFIYDRNFKNKRLIADKLEGKDIFLPNRGGVSLQRQFYCDGATCKKIAKTSVTDRAYIGFVVFLKSTFEKVKKNYIKERSEFDVAIKATPLDEKLDYLKTNIPVFVDMPGNPAHADLIYINPAVKADESPNTAIRSFSRKLIKECKIIIDENPYSDGFDDNEFNVLFD